MARYPRTVPSRPRAGGEPPSPRLKSSSGSQRESAKKLGVSEAQVSRDERNEYHGITVDRAQRVLDAMNETLTSRVEDKPLALA